MNAPLPANALHATTLDDKYTRDEGWVFMSGIQALVRLPIQQRLRDKAAGANTGGFISGYRGSPLGRYDMELWNSAALLKEQGIHFQPGVNEDLAATAVWGTQYVGKFEGAKVDGVFGIWYGKTPGVDRSADVLRHANGAGTSKWGGVLALCGDDHGAKSSTQAAQSDYILMATGIPVLYPANVQDVLDFGLHGLAMSRFSGCWVGLKVVTDVVESSASVFVGTALPAIVAPPQDALPADGLEIRRADGPLAQEARLYNHKLHAALTYARANRLNRVTLDSAAPKLGIVSAGKSYADTRQALVELGLDDAKASDLGIRLLKIGMVWPLEPEAITGFAAGLDAILVVEEKRPVLENQIKTILFDAGLASQVRVIGKYAAKNEWSLERGAPILSSVGELTPPQVAARIASLVGLACPMHAGSPLAPGAPGPVRMPNFCSGCPHNTSTQVPQGSRVLAGIGCHGIAVLQRSEHTGTISHMGGEGVMWVGQAPFTEEKHVFANLGDGTYYHSGFLAIRQAVAAKVSITYKLLVNGFVSMTGGQPIDGELTVPQIATELLAEGVGRIVVMTENLDRYAGVSLPTGVALLHRSQLENVQRELREYPNVSVLIYDQSCATELRRMRKRGKAEDPAKRTFIHAEVCEGCGDCSTKSNCMSIEPVETELGRKRRINQSSCNKDFSCIEGFCPSFVTVNGGALKKGRSRNPADAPFPELPEPQLPVLGAMPYGVLIAGIGGTGIVTVGAVLAMAAHLDGKAATALDLTGLAQKYGAVTSHVRISSDPALLQSSRLAAREADLVVGCDLIVTAGDEALSKMAPFKTHAVVNTLLTPTSAFAKDPDWKLDDKELQERIRRIAGADNVACIDATRIATELMGEAIAANMFMLGFAWQRGWVPVSRAAIERAIELNGTAVPLNLGSFLWGRRAAHDTAAVERVLQPQKVVNFAPAKLHRLADIVADRAIRLTAYQNEALAQRYRGMVERVAQAEKAQESGAGIAKAAARYYFKLLAVKDEFEVARLYADPAFHAQLAATYEGDYKLSFHLGAGPFARRDPVSGVARKRELGPWMMGGFRLLARLRFLRGSLVDPFRNNAERRLARVLLSDYERDLEQLAKEYEAGRVDGPRAALALEIASWPEQVRGYGHVRAAAAQKAMAQRERLWKQWSEGAEKVA